MLTRITAIFFLLIAAFLSPAQADEGRPLRTLPPEPSSSSSYTPLPTPNSPHSSYSITTSYILEQPLTQRYIEQYTRQSGINYLNAALERGSIYLPFIKEEIEKRNLPLELIYLPIIESSFVVTARSRSGAVGLWQFMMNSISPFNIKVNDFVDERRDFIKSTRGALQKLDDNYRSLGNWELALAAYNAGLGAVTRTIQRTGSRDYWELSEKNELKQETIHYVPKLIAAAYVISNPRKYGINVWHVPFEWESIPLSRQISIDILAEEAQIDRDLLRHLNAELIHGITPADSSYHLVIPSSKITEVNEVLGREDLKLIKYHYHTVRQGDTLWSMTRHYGTSLDLIEQHNPGISSRYLKLGETIIIPAFNDVTPMPAVQAASPVTASQTAASQPTSAQTTASSPTYRGSYVVQKGDTLWSISRRYGVTSQDLADANDMKQDQILSEGRTLKVPILE